MLHAVPRAFSNGWGYSRAVHVRARVCTSGQEGFGRARLSSAATENFCVRTAQRAQSHTQLRHAKKQSSLHRRNGYRRRPSASRTRRVAPWPAALQPARRRLPGSQERARRTNCRLRHGTWTKVICMGHVARVARVGILSTSSAGRFACAAVTWTVHPPQAAPTAHGWPCPHAVAIRASAPAVRVMVGQKEGGERARQVGALRAAARGNDV